MSPLANSDFRSLLNDADASVLQDRKRKKASGVTSSAATNLKRELRKQKYQKLKQKPKTAQGAKGDERDEQKDFTDEEEEMRAEYPAAYKDRAAARRGAEDEYSQVAHEFDAQKNRTVEESKYFGGDVSHTYLVKGLDYSLLNKVRTELEGKGIQTNTPKDALSHADNSVALNVSDNMMDRGARLMAKRVQHLITNDLHPHQVDFQNKLSKIKKVICQGAHFKGNTQNFLPGRMIFEYCVNASESPYWIGRDGRENADDSDPDEDDSKRSSDLPVLVLHSRNECDDYRATYDPGTIRSGGYAVCHFAPTDIIDELKDIQCWHGEVCKAKGGSQSRRQENDVWVTMEQQKVNLQVANARRLKQPLDAAVDDIFPGVGSDFSVAKTSVAPPVGGNPLDPSPSKSSKIDAFFSGYKSTQDDVLTSSESEADDASHIDADNNDFSPSIRKPRESAVYSLGRSAVSGGVDIVKPLCVGTATQQIEQTGEESHSTTTAPTKPSEVSIKFEDDIDVSGWYYYDDSSGDERQVKKTKGKKAAGKATSKNSRQQPSGVDELGRRHQALF